jgi:hypothetical protein
VVIDTNVPRVANRLEHEDPRCVLACVDALEAAMREYLVVIDQNRLIFEEYLNGRLSLSGQPGVGDAFMRWLYDHQADETRCECVPITPIPNSGGDCAEFPRDPDLSRFDLSDRKFVAVALGSAHRPTILNATDSDWREHEETLKRHGVSVEFLCPHLV